MPLILSTAGIYLGFSATDVHKPQSADVMDVWTRPRWEYELFLDTSPPMVRHTATPPPMVHLSCLCTRAPCASLALAPGP